MSRFLTGWARDMKSKGDFPSRPKRLPEVFSTYELPLYFVTANTLGRRALLARVTIHTAFQEYGQQNAAYGRAIGRYVIMPDHLHIFVRLPATSRLAVFVQLLKQCLTKVLKAEGEEPPFWQTGFFDHVLRNDENYAAKWAYVHQNPVRAGLVTEAEAWPYQGEFGIIDRA